jgi:UDP-4-amino-4,6-dideoxy-N-acetyl-beta-L-altrosamine N-acetyltransferase
MIVLRDLRAGDQEVVLEWRNQPEVRRWMYSDHEIQPLEHAHWFSSVLVHPAKKYWVINWEGRDVGIANLDQIDHKHRRCTWAFYLADASTRGQGIGKVVEFLVLRYVFEVLDFDRLWCEVLSTNEAVVRLHESFGFRREGLLRNHVVKDGGPADVVILALLKREWLLLRDSLSRLHAGEPVES